MKGWWISPLLLTVGFGGWQGYQWWNTPVPQPTNSQAAVALVKSMIENPQWRLGKNGHKVIVNESANLTVHEDGRVCGWNNEAFLITLSEKHDQALIALNYQKARSAVEGRMISSLFRDWKEEKKTVPVVIHDPLLSDEQVLEVFANTTLAGRKRMAAKLGSELLPMPRESSELLPMPKESIREKLDPIQRAIEAIGEPRKKEPC